MLQSLQRILAAALLLVALPAMAQSDPPARVGRLAHLENAVNFRVDRSDQGGPATLNWPISSGAILETGRPGRAEVWIGSTAYRVGDDSQVEFPVVDDNRVDVRLDDGSLAVSILDRDQADDVVVATPDGQVRFLTPGRYRIDTFADHSELTVLAGRATFADGQHVTPVAAGQRASRWNDGRERLDGAPGPDAFDQWVANRENATLAGTARRYVSPHMTGYQDLDAYGDWQSAPDYGTIWYPRGLADDWAPYRYGRWAWVAPWGWTWIDQAPWGFAPFHYGRWVIIGGRWAWVPGRLVPRPVYAPALVAWIGNPGWNVSFGFGAAPAVGWFPLGPREVYVPGHRHSHHYVRQVNVANIRDVAVIDRALRPGRHEAFEYRSSPRAVTVVPANLVREGRSISARDVRHPAGAELGRAPQARPAPNRDWLAPAPGAMRSHDGERRNFEGRPTGRDFDTARPDARERRSPGADGMLRETERPASRQGLPERGKARDGDAVPRPATALPEREPRREAAPLPMRREAPAPDVRQAVPEAPPGRASERRVDGPDRPGEATPLHQQHDGRQRPAAESPEPRQVAPEVPRGRATERRVDPFGRPAEAPPLPPRREERQRPVVPPPEREAPRDFQRMERQAPPREAAPPAFRQPEPQRPAPAPQVQREIHQPRAEPPRQPPSQGGGQGEPRRRHDDERGPR